MLSQGRRPSDSESVSSESTNATSRATTLPDSWSETASQKRQITSRSNSPKKEVIRSISPSTSSSTANTIISKKPNATQANTGNQQEKPWVNPYWGSASKLNKTATNNTNTNNQSPSNTTIKQLIPGSIVINDHGEIDNQSSKQRTRADSVASNRSFKAGGKFVSDKNGGSGGYLAPQHIHRRIVTSSPGLSSNTGNRQTYQQSSSALDVRAQMNPDFQRQQTFPGKTDNDTQPWVNPYWSKSNQNNSQQNLSKSSNANTNAPQKPTSSTGTWTNPYWKDSKPQNSSTSQQQQQSWKNPYWKDSKPQTSSTSQQQKSNQPWQNPYWKSSTSQTTKSNQGNSAWENPYWKNSKTTNSGPSNQQQQQQQQQNKQWKNPYWPDKDKTNNTGFNKSWSFEYRTATTPSFYKRIYPSDTLLSSSPVPSGQNQSQNSYSSNKANQNPSTNDEPPYTIDNRGVAHYRGTGSPPTSTTTQNPPPQQRQPIPPPGRQVPPPNSSGQAPPQFSGANNSSSPPAPIPPSGRQGPQPNSSGQAPPQFSGANNSSSPPAPIPSTLSQNYSSTNPSKNVMSAEEMEIIQRALDLFANPNNIQIREITTEHPSSNNNDEDTIFSKLAAVFTNNQGQQSNEQLPFNSSFPASGSGSAPQSSGNQGQQQQSSPLFSLFNKQGQQSNQQPPFNSSSPTSGFGSAPQSSGTQGQQQQQHSSPLFSLFNNQGKQSNQQSSFNSSFPASGFGSAPQFTGNQGQQQPPPSFSIFNNQGLQSNQQASLFPLGQGFSSTSNQNQQSQFQSSLFPSSGQVLHFDALSYPSNTHLLQCTLFSVPSYPSDGLVTKGPIVLI